MARRKLDHVTWVVWDTDHNACKCERCNTFQVLSLPMKLGAAIKAMNKFVRLHEACGEVQQ